MRVLLVDNYDSFTFNLAQLFRRAGADVDVIYSDRVDPHPERLGRYRAIVLSPGPGRPDRPSDVGRCLEVLDRVPRPVPVLGVCLGHQLMALREGAAIRPARRVMHGKTSRLVHDGSRPFIGVPRDAPVMRYHSWAVDPTTLPRGLVPTAWADDGTLMAFAHRDRPWWGFQFHPESVGTPHGAQMVRGFLAVERRHRSPTHANVVSTGR